MQQNRTQSLEEWKRDAAESSRNHAAAAISLGKKGWRLAVPATILAAIVGTTLFGTLSENVNFYIRLAVAVVAMAAAVLTGLQPVMRYPERAEKHRTIAAEYRSVDMELASFLDDYNASDRTMTDQEAKTAIDLIRKRIHDINMRAPELTQQVARRAEQRDAGTGKTSKSA
jgi:hypothetical protein